MFFSSWYLLFRVIVVATLTYTALVLSLRISGKRTLAQMNAFDYVVTVAFGSIMASAILSKEVVVAEVIVAFGILIVLQYGVAWLSLRLGWFKHLVKSNPHLLFQNGQFFKDIMEQERVAKSEIYQAIRNAGVGSLDQVEAVVLETNGKMSIIQHNSNSDKSSLEDVTNRLRRPS